MKRFYLALFIVMLLSLASAHSQPEIKENGLVLFTKTYENYAWEHQHNGLLIDSEGKVYSFHISNSDPGMLPLRKRSVTNDDLREEFNHNLKLIKNIGLEEVRKMADLIPEAAAASQSKSLPMGNDIGTYIWTAYEWNSTTGRFKAIKLKEDGDFASNNLSSAAKILVDWLDSLDPH